MTNSELEDAEERKQLDYFIQTDQSVNWCKCLNP